MCCPLASVENVLAAEWLWIKPLSLYPLPPPNAFTFVVWQVNVSWLSSEIFLYYVWWKTFGKLAVVPCTLQFVASIRSLGMKWEGRLQDKRKKRANYNMNSHLKNQVYTIFFVRRESWSGHSVKMLLLCKESMVFQPWNLYSADFPFE